MTKRIWSPVGFIAFIASGALMGQRADVPLNNWTVPPYTQATSGVTTMADVTPPRAFIGVQPCRVADTRGNGAPITGGIFANSGLRNWDVTGICGIPAGADAISVNFSVVSTAATPQGAFLLAWPTGSPPAPGTITAVMTFGPGVTIFSNAAIVPLGPGESLTVNVSHSTHVIMDVNGYFSDTLGNSQNNLALSNNSNTAATIDVRNVSTICGLPGCAIYAVAESGNAIFASAHQTGPSNVTMGLRVRRALRRRRPRACSARVCTKGSPDPRAASLTPRECSELTSREYSLRPVTTSMVSAARAPTAASSASRLPKGRRGLSSAAGWRSPMALSV